MTYSVVLLKEAVGGYCVYVPAFDAATQGDDLAEALWMAQDMIQGLLSVYAEDGRGAPDDVRTVSFDWGEASEALVCKVTIPEAQPVG
jgi:predicted RNase H-like HicB family nuclease